MSRGRDLGDGTWEGAGLDGFTTVSQYFFCPETIEI